MKSASKWLLGSPGHRRRHGGEPGDVDDCAETADTLLEFGSPQVSGSVASGSGKIMGSRKLSSSVSTLRGLKARHSFSRGGSPGVGASGASAGTGAGGNGDGVPDQGAQPGAGAHDAADSAADAAGMGRKHSKLSSKLKGGARKMSQQVKSLKMKGKVGGQGGGDGLGFDGGDGRGGGRHSGGGTGTSGTGAGAGAGSPSPRKKKKKRGVKAWRAARSPAKKRLARLQGHVPLTLPEVLKDPEKLPFLLEYINGVAGATDEVGGGGGADSMKLLFLLEIEQQVK
jgi:hypothetical protein